MNQSLKKQRNLILPYSFLIYLIISILFISTFSLTAAPPPPSSNPELESASSNTNDSNKNVNKDNNSSVDTANKEIKTSDNSPSQETPEKDNNDIAKQKEAFLGKIKELENQRRKLAFEIYQLRVKLIKEDPDLQSLQRSIMDMHRKMASKLNKKASMSTLLEKAQQIDSQIIDTINKNKNLDVKEKSNDN